LLREALKRMGRADLIGNGKRHLVPAWQPKGTGDSRAQRTNDQVIPGKSFRTQHTGLHARSSGATRGGKSAQAKRRARRSRPAR
jgi:hypothetical protein